MHFFAKATWLVKPTNAKRGAINFFICFFSFLRKLYFRGNFENPLLYQQLHFLTGFWIAMPRFRSNQMKRIASVAYGSISTSNAFHR